MSTPDLGRDIDAYCGRCKMVLAHTVTAKVDDAIKKCKCNTCGADHAYRATATSRAARLSKGPASKSARPRTVALSSQYDTLLGERSASDALDYSTAVDNLEVSMLLNHAKFGLGVIAGLKPGKKIEVVFPEAVKILVYGR